MVKIWEFEMVRNLSFGLLAVAGFFLFAGCRPSSVGGQAIELEIVNGCGQVDAAIQFKEVVAGGKLFVKSIKNAPNFNYNKTIIVSRTQDKVEINIVKSLLKIDDVEVIADTTRSVKFVVYLGNDYKKVIKRIKDD